MTSGLQQGEMRASKKPTVDTQFFLMVFLLFAASVLLRSWEADTRPLWNDEAFSWAITRGGVGSAIDSVSRDFHPPFYYVMLALWQQMFGDSVWIMRLPSIVAGSASILLTALAARILFDRQAAIVTGVLLAVHPSHLMWSQIARGYALLLLFSSVALYGFASILRSGPRKTTMSGVAMFVVGCTAASYTHNAGLLLWFTLSSALVWRVWRQDGWHQLRRLAIPVLAIPVLYAPWAMTLMNQTARIMNPAGSAYSSPYFSSSWSTILDALVESLSASHLWALRGMMLGLMTLALVLGVFEAIRNGKGWIPIILLGLPLAACTLGYVLIRPVFAYLLLSSRWYFLFVAMICAYGVVSLMQRFSGLGTLLFSALLVLGFISSFNATHTKRVEWDRLVGEIFKSPDALPVYASYATSLWAPKYYAARMGHDLTLLDDAPVNALPKAFGVLVTDIQDPALADWKRQHEQYVVTDNRCLPGACVVWLSRRE